ncbi:hypothetical protein [Pediococcus pentosaceus]|uniref:hypothetical protein n=1 Tax=Pediococcus pentosaceus TaxID=1255 RepID=UPI0011B75E7C|nr:hypothetical protein [Pediococcus pentosaceus]MCS8573799.1 hypothetical protein [Pediococcus pentosaceus]QDZ69416.1 hypothetical protein PSL001_00165 [Pediococcus pentosaceus]
MKKYTFDSLNFEQQPNGDIFGLSIEEFKTLLESVLEFAISKMRNKNMDISVLFGPFHCIVGRNEEKIVVGISNDNVLSGHTILSSLIDNNRALSVEDLKVKMNEVSKKQIGYEKNVFMVMDKSIFTDSIYTEIIKRSVKNENRLLSEIKKIGEEENTRLKATDLTNDPSYKIIESVQVAERVEQLSEFFEKLQSVASSFIQDLEKRNGIMNYEPIFKARNITVDEKLIFAVLPFSNERLEILDEIIKPGLEKSKGMTVVRSGNMFDANLDIMENIWTYINQAKVVLVDISEKNPNVFYELGICNTIGKPVIMICDEESYEKDYNSRLPFDIIAKNVIFYKNRGNGLIKLMDKLEKTVEGVLQGRPVLDV